MDRPGKWDCVALSPSDSALFLEREAVKGSSEACLQTRHSTMGLFDMADR